MPSFNGQRGPGRIERWRSDRQWRTIFFSAATLFWLLSAVPEAGWSLAWPLAAAAAFALCTVLEIRQWRQGGRLVMPVSTLPPELDDGLRARVAALSRGGERVAAISLVRAETGAGLLAAKRAVEAADG